MSRNVFVEVGQSEAFFSWDRAGCVVGPWNGEASSPGCVSGLEARSGSVESG
jgi:hypothetical protein